MTSTDTSRRDKILGKIRKLLAVANNGSATEAEVESYMAAARKLMDEHNIDEAEALSSAAGKKTAYDSMCDHAAVTRINCIKHEVLLSLAVCAICDVGTYRSAGGRSEEIHFYGLPTDVAVAKEFFTYICTSAKLLAKKVYGKAWGLQHFHYCEGFAARIATRAEELKKGSAQPGLVLCKSDMIRRYGEDKLHLRRVPMSASSAHSDAYLHGWRDGAAVDLGVDGRLMA